MLSLQTLCVPFSIQILAFLLVCVIICLIGSLIFESVYGVDFVGYADYYSTAQDNPAEISFLQILSSIVVLSNYVPISLYVRSVPVYVPMSLYVGQYLCMCPCPSMGQYLCMCPCLSMSGQYLCMCPYPVYMHGHISTVMSFL